MNWNTGHSIEWSQMLAIDAARDRNMNPTDIVFINENGVNVDTPTFAGMSVAFEYQYRVK